MKRMIFASLISLSIFSVMTVAQDHRKVNCNAQFQFERSKITASVTAVKGIQGSFGLDPQVLVQFDKWTGVALDQQRALCDAYKTSSESAFPTSLYLEQLDKLRAWEIDFFKAILTFQQATEVKSGKGGGDLPTLTNTLKDQLLAAKPLEPDLSQAPSADSAYKQALEKITKEKNNKS